MIENIEALIVLAREDTITKTATRLRITQSAVSKRLAALEAAIGEPVIEKKGRGVALTETGLRLVSQAQPLLSELRSVLATQQSGSHMDVTVGVSESLLCSWGAEVLHRAEKATPGLRLSPHTHRSPVVLDRVRSGEYMLGLCSGLEKLPSGIVGETVFREPMVLIGNKSQLDREANATLLSIEPQSVTWRSLGAAASTLGLRPTQTLETFFAVAQVANVGFGVGLVPLGVARAMRISPKKIHPVTPQLTRPVTIIGQKTAYNKPAIRKFVDEVKNEIGRLNLQ